MALRLPGGFSVDLLRYWDGQPVYFVCCERVRPDSDSNKDGKEGGSKPEEEHPIGRVFWCVVIEILDEEEEEQSESEGSESDGEGGGEGSWEDASDNADDVD